MKYICQVCGYVYDEAAEACPFDQLPDSWQCPWCKAPKTQFKPEKAEVPAEAASEAADDAGAVLDTFNSVGQSTGISMSDLTMGLIETRFAELIWSREPISTGELTALAQRELGWKRSTMYTVLRRLCDKGLFTLEEGTVRSRMSRETYEAVKSEQLIDSSFGGSVPAFLAAFTRRRKLTEAEVKELRALIDGLEEGRKK